ncbi:fluoride efflux transporter CrcB [Staphylococcus devriesei]|uniref:fluoride efflux transporter CrcB n=1 Tax=Staphylococcus devriesei TaxID=586733 RepID=UPI000E681EA4|nr:fluoride efflux transporter CrcB [Staphylococcus devriesei]RIL70947.1 fluoride efflux transporter CrcB [Staphylococcus devriesei]
MINGLLVMLGGGLGAIVRGWLSDYIKKKWSSSFPIATLIVNVCGSFLIGLVFSMTLHYQWFGMFIVTGFLGGLTTFSTMSYELVQMLTSKFSLLRFISYTLLQFIVGFIACYIGYTIN